MNIGIRYNRNIWAIYKLNLRENKNWGKKGECGSPVIDLEGKVTGVFVGHITLIKDVLEAIDNLE